MIFLEGRLQSQVRFELQPRIDHGELARPTKPREAELLVPLLGSGALLKQCHAVRPPAATPFAGVQWNFPRYHYPAKPSNLPGLSSYQPSQTSSCPIIVLGSASRGVEGLQKFHNSGMRVRPSPSLALAFAPSYSPLRNSSSSNPGSLPPQSSSFFPFK